MEWKNSQIISKRKVVNIFVERRFSTSNHKRIEPILNVMDYDITK